MMHTRLYGVPIPVHLVDLTLLLELSDKAKRIQNNAGRRHDKDGGGGDGKASELFQHKSKRAALLPENISGTRQEERQHESACILGSDRQTYRDCAGIEPGQTLRPQSHG